MVIWMVNLWDLFICEVNLWIFVRYVMLEEINGYLMVNLWDLFVK